jgi:hypothetical protein
MAADVAGELEEVLRKLQAIASKIDGAERREALVVEKQTILPASTDPHIKALRNNRFVEDFRLSGPFADVGAQGGVDDPAKMLQGWTSGFTPEAAVGRYLTSPAALLKILARRQRAVALVTASGTNFQQISGTWTGTAFLVAENILLTNHHVLNTVQVAQAAEVEFNFEISEENLLMGNAERPKSTKAFRLDPARLFVTSPTLGGLDYTFVWIESAAHDEFGAIPLERSTFTIEIGTPAFVIHHPDGDPKEASLDDNEIVGITTRVIHYKSDTKGGSSGAPVLDARGRLIALHHASNNSGFTLRDGSRIQTLNEGVKIAAIAIDLENKMRSGTAEAMQAEAVLREVKGSDTMSGFFGALGRDVPATGTRSEAVVETYKSTDQDIDLGFWTVEWLADANVPEAKLRGAARIIADLNLEAVGLPIASDANAKALATLVESLYGDRYDYRMAAGPEGAGGSSAMLWKKSSLRGETIPWPNGLEPLFARPDLFDQYPGLFLLKTTDWLPPYSFYVAPLTFKTMDYGSRRKMLAARLLARSVEETAFREGHDAILGGDMFAPLLPEDFQDAETAGYAVLGAQDERQGTVSYLRGPKSQVNHVFLSPGMKLDASSQQYMTVIQNRSMSGFIKEVSDHQPITLRLSFGKGSPLPEVDSDDIDAILDSLVQSTKPKRVSVPRKPAGRKKQS